MEAKTILTFIEEIGRLKNIARAGWVIRGITSAESIADHSYRVALMSMIIADTLAGQGVEVDAERVMRIALLHDIAEARLGDIPYPAQRYIPEDVKEEAEKAALADMLQDFGALQTQYTALWEEFENSSSFEGKIVRAVDKLEMMIQVHEYETAGHRSLGEFWDNDWNQRSFHHHPIFMEIYEWLLKKRG